MFIKNLLRRKIRTFLTIIGISIGVAAIIGLGALADGFETGYQSMLTGSKADLILSQPDAVDISYSSIDQEVGEILLTSPEISEVSGMLQGFTQAESEPFLFVFGYPEDSFLLGRFQIKEGVDLTSPEAYRVHGVPVLLGSAAAEILNKDIGDSVRMANSAFRVVGIYETGDAFEDSGALLKLADAQELLGKPRQVSIFYIRVKDPTLTERLIQRVERRFPDLSISGIDEYSKNQNMQDMLRVYVWAIGGLAILIGGVGMMNAQLMAIMERTREIGVLRAVGWRRWRILRMILLESITVGILGGCLGILLGWVLLYALSQATLFFGVDPSNIGTNLISQAFLVVIVLGFVGGIYPAWRASQMKPIEALRYEGGSAGARVRRLPIGGMAVQSLWQRAGRTVLTLGTIALTVGAIIALEAVVRGFTKSFNNVFLDSNIEIIIRQADVADTSLSAIDQRIGAKITAMPEVRSLSGYLLTAVSMPEAGGYFLLFGLSPHELAIQRYNVVEGKPISTNHQIMIGRMIADSLNLDVGDTFNLSGSRFRIAGIYESNVGWEEMGGIITIRDAQAFIGRPRKVTMYMVKLVDPKFAESVVAEINHQFPEVHAALAGEFLEQMPDMQSMDGMMAGISFLAILIGGVGVLNTMLMSVFERTREIGVLRAVGWRRRRVLGLILKEALLLGLLGGSVGILIAFSLVKLLQATPMIGTMLDATWEIDIFLRAIAIALLLGVVGGIYPAFRATRLQPVEALRYE
jgi:ABC-type lipoprotein release transport system permease subunit